MKDRIKFMYEGGGTSLVQILLTSESMGDFLNKAEYVATISQYDRKMLEELQQVRSNVEKKQNDLEQQQSKLSGLQETLTSKRDELNSKISSTSGELADYQAQLDRAKAAEEALKLAQNDEVSGSVKADDAKNTETSNTNTNTNNANKNNQTASTNTNNTNKNNTTNTNSPTVNNGNSTPASTTDVALLAAILQCEAGGYNEPCGKSGISEQFARSHLPVRSVCPNLERFIEPCSQQRCFLNCLFCCPGSTWRRKTFCSYKLFTVPLSIYRRIWYKCWWKCIFLIFIS